MEAPKILDVGPTLSRWFAYVMLFLNVLTTFGMVHFMFKGIKTSQIYWYALSVSDNNHFVSLKLNSVLWLVFSDFYVNLFLIWLNSSLSDIWSTCYHKNKHISEHTWLKKQSLTFQLLHLRTVPTSAQTECWLALFFSPHVEPSSATTLWPFLRNLISHHNARK